MAQPFSVKDADVERAPRSRSLAASVPRQRRRWARGLARQCAPWPENRPRCAPASNYLSAAHRM